MGLKVLEERKQYFKLKLDILGVKHALFCPFKIDMSASTLLCSAQITFLVTFLVLKLVSNKHSAKNNRINTLVSNFH